MMATMNDDGQNGRSLPDGWEWKSLGTIANVDWGNTSITKKSYVENGFPAFSATGQDGFLPFAEHEGDAIIVSAIGARCGKCFYARGQWTAIKNTLTVTEKENFFMNYR